MADQTNESKDGSDTWSQWLLDRRHGGNAEYRRRVQAVVERYRDRVLDGARLGPGMTLVDIGTGDGLIGFGAIDRIGPSLKVILTDVSLSLLRHTEEAAARRNVREQCTFIAGSADNLGGIGNASVDAVATRAVLVYVGDKAAAFREFYRVLRPGGRVSIAEPIYQDEGFEASALANLVQTQPNHPDIKFLRLLQRYRSAQFPSTPAEVLKNPITNYNERDLFRFARDAGFANIHLELHMDLRPSLEISWEAHLDVATHPWAPTLREILAQKFSSEEAQAFEQACRPVVENSQSVQKEITAYLTADKPAAA
jgi:ubiquinone/menaquinone biosynthesis C-methylase UbiE